MNERKEICGTGNGTCDAADDVSTAKPKPRVPRHQTHFGKALLLDFFGFVDRLDKALRDGLDLFRLFLLVAFRLAAPKIQTRKVAEPIVDLTTTTTDEW